MEKAYASDDSTFEQFESALKKRNEKANSPKKAVKREDMKLSSRRVEPELDVLSLGSELL